MTLRANVLEIILNASQHPDFNEKSIDDKVAAGELGNQGHYLNLFCSCLTPYSRDTSKKIPKTNFFLFLFQTNQRASQFQELDESVEQELQRQINHKYASPFPPLLTVQNYFKHKLIH